MNKGQSQLNLFDNLYSLQEEGFTIEKSFHSKNKSKSKFKFKRLENTYSVLLDENIVLYVQDNENGTYNTFGFNHARFNVNLQEVKKIVRNKNNWCLFIRKDSESNE